MPLNVKELDYFNDKLTDLREDIRERKKQLEKNSNNKDDANIIDNHMADAATELYDEEKEHFLKKEMDDKLQRIDEALKRIFNKTYGYCIDTGERIKHERLEAVPYVERTVSAQEKFEEKKRKNKLASNEDKQFKQDDGLEDSSMRTIDKIEDEHDAFHK